MLTETMRPATLSQVIGQKLVVEALRKQMTTRPAHAIMFHGPPGTGKTSLSRIVAISLQCDHQQVWGDPCKECQEASFDIHEVNASEANGVEDAAQLVERARYRPTFGKYRVLILSEAQRLTSQAQQLLLKPTEEPPPTTVWIIDTSEPTKINAALRRRFISYQLKPLTLQGTEALLQRAAKRIGLKQPLAPLVEQLLEQQVTSPGLQLMAFEKYANGVPAEQAAGILDEVTAETLPICKAVTEGNWSKLRALLQKANPDEARLILASVSGWMRGCLWRENSPKRAEALALGIAELNSGLSPLDDKRLMLWLIGTLYKVSRRLAN